MRVHYERHDDLVLVCINGTDIDGDGFTEVLNVDDAERLAEELMDAVKDSREETAQ